MDPRMQAPSVRYLQRYQYIPKIPNLEKLEGRYIRGQYPPGEKRDHAISQALQCRELLIKCGMQTVCLCKHGKLPEDHDYLSIALSRYLQDSKDQLNRYSLWPIDKLENLALRRNIPLVKHLPKPNKQHTLAKLLEDTDHGHPFRLLDLPAEIRLEIYKLVLLSGQDQNIRIFGQVRQPALLRTCKKIRSETLPVYYGKSWFSLQLPFEDSVTAPSDLMDDDTKAWLQQIGPHNIQMLRQVSFYFFSLHNQYNLHINLDSSSGEAWSLTTAHKIPCPCKRLKVRSLAQLRQHFTDGTEREPLERVLPHIDESIRIANAATHDFRAQCNVDGHFEPTEAGLYILARAALSVLTISSEWNQLTTEALAERDPEEL
ncbi:hypothetical protein KCU93_g2667, partial [Aureobasidium melanogenum]